MTDYNEEQSIEIEALQSIYPDELTVVKTEPRHCFTVSVKTPDFKCDSQKTGAFCVLTFTYVDKYPDVQPNIAIDQVVNINDSDVEALASYLDGLAEENLGMVMIFTLVSAAQEWMTNKLEELEREKVARIIQEAEEREAVERRKYEGTKVTVESFLCWKAKFDEERLRTKKAEKDTSVPKKLTGRELFEKDDTLNESDIQFLQGDEVVKVDESLFQELDDLELQDDFDNE